MKTENILIHEERIGYFIETTEEKFPDVKITKSKLFIGSKEVEDYNKYATELNGKLPTKYVIRNYDKRWGGYGFEGGFDLIKDDDGSLFWYSGTTFKNLKDAFKHIDEKLECKNWIITVEEPM